MIDSAAGETSAPPRPCRRAERDELPGVGREPVEQGGDREEDHAGDEDALAAEDVGRAPAEQQEAAEQQRVAVHDPLQVGVG